MLINFLGEPKLLCWAQIANVKSCAGLKLMSFVKVVPFVLVQKKHEAIAIEAFNRAMDDLVIRHIPLLNSGVESVEIDHVENAEEILKEFDETSEDY